MSNFNISLNLFEWENLNDSVWDEKDEQDEEKVTIYVCVEYTKNTLK